MSPDLQRVAEAICKSIITCRVNAKIAQRLGGKLDESTSFPMDIKFAKSTTLSLFGWKCREKELIDLVTALAFSFEGEPGFNQLLFLRTAIPPEVTS